MSEATRPRAVQNMEAESSNPGAPSLQAHSPIRILEAAHQIRVPLTLVRDPGTGRLGVLAAAATGSADDVARLPPLFPEWLGDRSFAEVHHVRFPYVVGEMANGLTTTRAVCAAARAGFIGFFGAGGLTLPEIEAAIAELARELGERGPWGSNLIHSPDDPALEEATVDLYLRSAVRWVSASAFMSLTPAVVRYAATGLYRDVRGQVRRRNFVFAKVSRPEVARLFLSPAPRELLASLVAAGRLSELEASLAERVPLADDITVEADSGGHTDNRPLSVIFPAIAALRDELSAEHGFERPIRLGAAGGLGTPSSVAGAFALGAAYVLTGSVNQCAVESGLGASGKELLASAGLADVMMAPAADMFELGAKVQVLRTGTMFGPRACRLHELYLAHPSLDALPPADRARLESEVFRAPLAKIWEETERFWRERDPSQLERAAGDPKHKMALCFRWYLGLSSRWPIQDAPARRMDFQIWTGPAIGSFNAWVRGSFLESLANRTVAQIGLNLLEGAAVATRAQQLRSAGVAVPAAAFNFRPRPIG